MFRKVAIVCSLLRSIISLTPSNFPKASMTFLLLSEFYIQSNCSWLPLRCKCYYNIFVLSFLASHCCGSWESQLGKNIGCFPPIITNTVPSSTMKASLPREGILVRSNLSAPRSASQVPALFNHDP